MGATYDAVAARATDAGVKIWSTTALDLERGEFAEFDPTMAERTILIAKALVNDDGRGAIALAHELGHHDSHVCGEHHDFRERQSSAECFPRQRTMMPVVLWLLTAAAPPRRRRSSPDRCRGRRCCSRPDRRTRRTPRNRRNADI